MSKNVLGTELETCCMDPLTGFYRTGRCDTGKDDRGMHTVCVRMTDEFLEFACESGNDLITPAVEYGFPGLVAGDQWCVCLGTVVEAIRAGKSPQIVLESTHISVIEFVDLDTLKHYAAKA